MIGNRRRHLPAEEILAIGRRVVSIEGAAVQALAARVDERFARALGILAACEGRVVCTGMGKSGLVARKIAATMASTGTPALYLDPAEAAHGDLGMLARGDVVVALSYSGETQELLDLLPSMKRFGLPLVAMVGNGQSTLAQQSDVWLDVGVAEEACSLNLAPTASTTAALAMGDALAVALLEERGFRPEDFALLHPAGALGRRLLLRVQDLMHTGDRLPVVAETASMQEAILEITGKRLGMTAVVDGGGRLTGILTDGDLRRAMQRFNDVVHRPVADCMTRNPKRIEREALAARAVQVMEHHSITSLLVVDGAERPEGVIHLHDLLKAGVV
ncbi:MAG TPA: KpsF/GutQ family sugar-phosphate isomerase [Candidatus Sulfotelmatobacter sp.]|nr:KpsF/GutQ family sugar-phosphate isomerase [Candidatus Sulfotelmatobacter sp.]